MDLVKDPDFVSVKELDNTFIEKTIFNLFKIDIINYIKVKATLAKEFHIQPSEIEQMPAWEYEMFMMEINNMVKEENARNKEEMDKAGIDKAKKMSDPSYMRKMQNSSMQSMTKMPEMKMPKIS